MSVKMIYALPVGHPDLWLADIMQQRGEPKALVRLYVQKALHQMFSHGILVVRVLLRGRKRCVQLRQHCLGDPKLIRVAQRIRVV